MRIVVGRVGAPVGLAGAIRVWSYTSPPEALLGYGTLRVDARGTGAALTLRRGARHGRALVVEFEEVADRTAAARLTGAELSIERAQLPVLPAGEYYWVDLIGLDVVNRDGVQLGQVVDLMETGANDVLVVRDGASERLIPYLRGSVVCTVDLTRRRLEVDWDAEF